MLSNKAGSYYQIKLTTVSGREMLLYRQRCSEHGSMSCYAEIYFKIIYTTLCNFESIYYLTRNVHLRITDLKSEYICNIQNNLKF